MHALTDSEVAVKLHEVRGISDEVGNLERVKVCGVGSGVVTCRVMAPNFHDLSLARGSPFPLPRARARIDIYFWRCGPWNIPPKGGMFPWGPAPTSNGHRRADARRAPRRAPSAGK